MSIITSKDNTKNNSPQLNLEKILKVVSPIIKSLDSQILKNAKTDLPLLNKISEHILISGGKRLRPILTLKIWVPDPPRPLIKL